MRRTAATFLALLLFVGAPAGAVTINGNTSIAGNLGVTGTGSFTGGVSFGGIISGAGITSMFASPPPTGGTSPNTGAFTALSASGTVSGAGFAAYLASPPPTGSTTPNTGAFTTLRVSSTISGAGVTALFASPPAIGGTTAAPATFTTLTLTGSVTPNLFLASPDGLSGAPVYRSIVPGDLPAADFSNRGGVTIGVGINVASSVISVAYGTTAGTAVQGNDARIAGALLAGNNLTDLTNTTSARTALGLGSMATQAASSVNITGGSIAGVAASFTTLAASSTVSGSGFSSYLASPPAIGGTTPAAGAFAALTATTLYTTGNTVVGAMLYVNNSLNNYLYWNGQDLQINSGGLIYLPSGRSYTISGAYGFLNSAGTAGGGTPPATSTFGVVASYRIVASEFDATSDGRLKTDISDITPERGREFVLRSQPKTFILAGERGAGFIAQDQVRAGFGDMIHVVPYAGLQETVDPDGFVSPANAKLVMEYDQAIPYLTAALKAAFQEIAALRRARH